MHINETLKNFLYDLNYFITIYDNFLYLYNYEKVITISEEEIDIEFINFIMLIKGTNLKITKMTSKEMRIEGVINNLEFKYE